MNRNKQMLGAEYMRQRGRNSSRCTRCPEETEINPRTGYYYWNCKKCRKSETERRRENMKDRAENLKKKGICVHCSKPAMKNPKGGLYVSCEYHHMKNRERTINRTPGNRRIGRPKKTK